MRRERILLESDTLFLFAFYSAFDTVLFPHFTLRRGRIIRLYIFSILYILNEKRLAKWETLVKLIKTHYFIDCIQLLAQRLRFHLETAALRIPMVVSLGGELKVIGTQVKPLLTQATTTTVYSDHKMLACAAHAIDRFKAWRSRCKSGSYTAQLQNLLWPELPSTVSFSVQAPVIIYMSAYLRLSS